MKMMRSTLKSLLLTVIVFDLAFKIIIYAQPVQQVIYDSIQYPGYPVKTVLTPVLPSLQDSIPLHLLQPVRTADIASINWQVGPQLFWNQDFPYVPSGQFYYGEQYPPYIFSIPIGISWVITQVCGDSFYENGQLSSSIECVDSVYHGKAIYWDETGHKTSESTYFEGHQIKQKSYDSRGRVTHVNHFDYQGQYHGICLYYNYDANTKTVSRYEHGVQDGKQEEYQNDKLEKESICENGSTIERSYYYSEGSIMNKEIFNDNLVMEGIHYDRDGSIIYHEKRNQNKEQEFIRRWSTDGFLIEEKNFIDGKLNGEVLVSNDLTTKIRETEFYENGVIQKYEKRKENLVLCEKHFEKGVLSNQLNYFENGDTLYYAEYNQSGVMTCEKMFAENALPVREIYRKCAENEVPMLTGQGCYSVPDTTYFYSIESDVWYQIEKRIVVYKGDTIRLDYLVNNANVKSTPIILASNHFEKRGDNFYPCGEWKYYSENKLDSVVTYQNGMKCGRVVYYKVSNLGYGDSLHVDSYGLCQNNLKEGEWTFFHFCMMEQGLVTESERMLNFSSSDYSIITFTANEVNGSYRYYDCSNRLRTQGTYVDGEAVGKWIYYNAKGEIVRKVNYKNGESSKRNLS